MSDFTPERRQAMADQELAAVNRSIDAQFPLLAALRDEQCGSARAALEKGTPASAGAELTPVSTVLVALARALREQPTGRQILDGLDELGELSVCDEDPREIAATVAALCYLAQIPAPAPPGPTVVYRAAGNMIGIGLYTTAEAAQQHCEALVSREYPADVALVFDWSTDEEDGALAVAELGVQVDGGDEATTGYTVTPLEVAAAYDPDADE
ncbi:hypothetical protein ACIRD8_35195 [Streptomyces sp. NPDC102451]|uniref:hypothetical protein n=1 Tax=Streptomyces sp. NPDC102451 TaxID=3366177 RepID=UPI0037FB5E46